MLGNPEELTILDSVELKPTSVYIPSQARFPCRKYTFIPLFTTSVLSLLWALLHATGLNGSAEPPVLCEGFIQGPHQTSGTQIFSRVPRLLQELAELERARLRAGHLQIMCPSKACSKLCCLSVAYVQSLIQQELDQTSRAALLFLSRGQRLILGGLTLW